MRFLFVFCLVFTGFAALCAVDSRGVGVSAKASETEKYAASELVRYLTKMTGSEFKLVAPEKAKYQVGSEFVEARGLGNEGFAVETGNGVTKIGGGTPEGRGTLYGVYEFLERCGCRFWTVSEEYVPRLDSGNIPEVNLRQIPGFPEYRFVISNGAMSINGKWKTNCTCSGWGTSGKGAGTDPKWGIVHDLLPFNSHSLMFFIPPEKYFAGNPEFFALHGNQRVADKGTSQLCLTNEKMTDEFIRNCRNYLKQSYKPGMILDVSQEDNTGYCQCPDCRKVNTEEGAESGTLVRFVNKVAAALEKDYPELRLKTLAYQHTRFASKVTKLHRNVILDLCNIECDFAQAFSGGKENESFAKELDAWKKMASGLSLTDYGTTFDNYLLPLPNFDALAQRLRGAKDNNVVAYYTINAHNSPGGEFNELRNYLTAKLLWDCELDPWAVTREFCEGYYGKGGRHIYDYIRWYHNELLNRKKGTFYYTRNPVSLYDAEYLAAAKEFFRKAYEESGSVPECKTRLDRSYLSVRAMELEYANIRNDHSEEQRKLTDEFEKECARFHVTHISEGMSVKQYIESLRLNIVPPDFCKNLPAEDWIARKPSAYCMNDWAKSVADPLSASGNPVRLNTNHIAWAVYQKMAQLPGMNSEVLYDVYASVRMEAMSQANDRSFGFEYGWYDGPGKLKKGVCRLRDIPAGKYSYIRIAEKIPPTLSGYVWIAPLNNPDKVRYVFVDHMIFVKVRK